MLLFFLLCGIVLENLNKKKNPTNTILIELMYIIIPFLVYLSINKNNYNLIIYNLINIVIFIAIGMYIFRFFNNFNTLIKIPFYYNILSLIAILCLFNNYTTYINPFIILYCSYKITNKSGFNFIIDIPIILCLLYSLQIVNFNEFKSEIYKNFIISDIIYHILEFILFIILFFNKKNI